MSTEADLSHTSELLDLMGMMRQWRSVKPAEWFVPHDRGQRQFLQSSKPIRVLVPGNGFGKGLRDDEPVLTPDGWKLIGDVQPGDTLIGGDGRPTRVIEVFRRGEQDCHRITFNDNTSIICDGDHLWRCQLRRNRSLCKDRAGDFGLWQVVDTASLVRRFGTHPKPADRAAIPSVSPVEFSRQTVPMDPYNLGLLLGDGSFAGRSSVKYSSADPYLVDALRTEFDVRKIGKTAYDWSVCGAYVAVRALGLSGHLSHTKWVPPCYLWNTPDVRLAVLQGLMDTDGSVDQGSSSCEFCTTSPQLARDVRFLVQSLGGVVTEATRVTKYTYKGEKKDGRRSHRLNVWLPVCPFRLPRKVERWRPILTNPGRIVRSITPEGRHPTTCLRVDNALGLFVARDFIVTHNSTVMAHDFNQMATHSNRYRQVQVGPVLGVWFGKLKDQIEIIREQIHREVFGTTVKKMASGEFIWPDGSRLLTAAANDVRSWQKWQGINPDWIGFDETPPRSLWREAMWRRRGKKSTMYVLGATQTEGITWAHADLFIPWRDHHAKDGIDPQRAQHVQSHPDIWLWFEGGAQDNPGNSAEQIAFLKRQSASLPPKMAKVRLYGGFESWVGDPYFNEAAIERIRKTAQVGRTVQLVPVFV